VGRHAIFAEERGLKLLNIDLLDLIYSSFQVLHTNSPIGFLMILLMRHCRTEEALRMIWHDKPKFIVEDVDRYGNVRIYFCRRGQRKIRIRAMPGSAEFGRPMPPLCRASPSWGRR